MWFGVVMMNDDVVLLAGSLGLDGCMEAVELGQVDVAVEGMNFFARSVWNQLSFAPHHCHTTKSRSSVDEA